MIFNKFNRYSVEDANEFLMAVRQGDDYFLVDKSNGNSVPMPDAEELDFEEAIDKYGPALEESKPPGKRKLGQGDAMHEGDQ
jgi:hypothetical protein